MNEVLNLIQQILSLKIVAYPIAAALVIIGVLCVTYVFYTMYASYKEAKKTGKPTSWLKLSDDIRWTLYCWDDRDKEYVMSLPRLIYFVSALLIVYVVLTDKTDMLTPLLGFNLSAMAAYTSKRYFEGKEETARQEDENDLELELAKINENATNWKLEEAMDKLKEMAESIESGDACKAGGIVEEIDSSEE